MRMIDLFVGVDTPRCHIGPQGLGSHKIGAGGPRSEEAALPKWWVLPGAPVEGRREVSDCVVSAAEAGKQCRRIFKRSRGTAVPDYSLNGSDPSVSDAESPPAPAVPASPATYGCRFLLFIGPCSPLSQQKLQIRLRDMLDPPPKPSLRLSPAQGPLNTTFRSKVVSQLLA